MNESLESEECDERAGLSGAALCRRCQGWPTIAAVPALNAAEEAREVTGSLPEEPGGGTG